MNQHQAVSYAYFDGFTVEQIADANLDRDDLIEIAALCWKWSHQHPSVSEAYAARAAAIIEVADGKKLDEIELPPVNLKTMQTSSRILNLNSGWNPRPAKGWPAR